MSFVNLVSIVNAIKAAVDDEPDSEQIIPLFDEMKNDHDIPKKIYTTRLALFQIIIDGLIVGN